MPSLPCSATNALTMRVELGKAVAGKPIYPATAVRGSGREEIGSADGILREGGRRKQYIVINIKIFLAPRSLPLPAAGYRGGSVCYTFKFTYKLIIYIINKDSLFMPCLGSAENY